MITMAMADMSRTPYAIAVVLVIGVILLRLLGPKETRSRMWLLITAFLAGPLIALCLLLLDIFVISRDYMRAITINEGRLITIIEGPLVA
jgi:hypothetical protein